MEVNKMTKEEKRKQKYPDTETFHYYNANPKNRLGCDCAIRAICTAMEQSWQETVREMTEVGISIGYVVNDPKTIEKYLQLKGWGKHKQPKKPDGTKYTGKEFCERARSYENYIANIGGHHMVAIVGARVQDIWDSTNKCIGNYWTKG